MKFLTIPNTQINVSTICLGTMTFGRPVSEAEGIRIVSWAIDNGINFIDTADGYEGYDRFVGSAGGVAEEILGKALRGRREKVIITTKVGNSIGGADYTGSGLGSEHIMHQIEASLKRLQTDYLDFYELHVPDPETPLTETLETMANLTSAGKIRYWGFSNFEVEQIQEMLTICDANGLPRPVISQPPYSWLKRDIETGHLPFCRENGIGATPYRPLEGGLLTGKYSRGQPLPSNSRAAENPNWLSEPDDALFSKLQEFKQEARTAGFEPGRYALKWLLDQAGICSVVVGVKRIEQLEDLI